jgi:hypothetical protein
MEKKKGLSFRQFAALIGVSPPTVTTYVKQGLIPKNALIKDGKRPRIDPDKARPALDKNLDPGQRKKGQAPVSKEFIDAKTDAEIYKGKLAAQRYELKAEKYISRDWVTARIRKANAILSKRCLELSGKLAPILAKEKSEFKCLKIINDETRKCLKRMCADIDEQDL